MGNNRLRNSQELNEIGLLYLLGLSSLIRKNTSFVIRYFQLVCACVCVCVCERERARIQIIIFI